MDKLKEQLTVVIPTLNEEAAIGTLISEVKEQGFSSIIVADGYSKDRTREIATSLGVKVVMQHGRGKGGAFVTAFREVSTPYLLVMDGDGSYDPKDIDKFTPLIGSYDLVKGVRPRNENMSRVHAFGNRVITKTFDILFGTSIGDVCSGMYMMRTGVVKSLHLEKHPLTVEQEIAAQIAQFSFPITTVPIDYRRRLGGVSKTRTWRQGFRDLYTNFDLARVYNPIMLFSILASLVLIPAFAVLGYAIGLYIVMHNYRSGLFLGGLVLLVLGTQGFTVATIASMFRRIERKLSLVQI